MPALVLQPVLDLLEAVLPPRVLCEAVVEVVGDIRAGLAPWLVRLVDVDVIDGLVGHGQLERVVAFGVCDLGAGLLGCFFDVEAALLVLARLLGGLDHRALLGYYSSGGGLA